MFLLFFVSVISYYVFYVFHFFRKLSCFLAGSRGTPILRAALFGNKPKLLVKGEISILVGERQQAFGAFRQVT